MHNKTWHIYLESKFWIHVAFKACAPFPRGLGRLSCTWMNICLAPFLSFPAVGKRCDCWRCSTIPMWCVLQGYGPVRMRNWVGVSERWCSCRACRVCLLQEDTIKLCHSSITAAYCSTSAGYSNWLSWGGKGCCKCNLEYIRERYFGYDCQLLMWYGVVNVNKILPVWLAIKTNALGHKLVMVYICNKLQ